MTVGQSSVEAPGLITFPSGPHRMFPEASTLWAHNPLESSHAQIAPPEPSIAMPIAWGFSPAVEHWTPSGGHSTFGRALAVGQHTAMIAAMRKAARIAVETVIPVAARGDTFFDVFLLLFINSITHLHSLAGTTGGAGPGGAGIEESTLYFPMMSRRHVPGPLRPEGSFQAGYGSG